MLNSPETAFASVTHPNSVTAQTDLLGLDRLFGITDSNATSDSIGRRQLATNQVVNSDNSLIVAGKGLWDADERGITLIERKFSIRVRRF